MILVVGRAKHLVDEAAAASRRPDPPQVSFHRSYVRAQFLFQARQGLVNVARNGDDNAKTVLRWGQSAACMRIRWLYALWKRVPG